ncbi:hypothetical protein GCM10027347_42900 [Larkinella harenae]
MKTDTLLGIGKNYVGSRVLIGIVIFFGWLLLFIFGMSIQSSELKIIESGKGINWENLIVYGLSFTPTNTAIMAALGGIIGGIASNLSAYNQKKHVDISELDTESFEYRSLIYMSEHPLVSMFRGFLAYLILVAGSYIANFTMPVDSDHPTTIQGMSASSYFKFAVTVSLLSYLVGYDPTQLQRLIGSLNVGGRKATDFEGRVRIKDGKHIAEGEFVGKAVPATTGSIEDDEDQGTTTNHTSLNGKAKSRKTVS